MKWIDVKDKLPDFYEIVLIFCGMAGMYMGTYERIENDFDCGVWKDHHDVIVIPPTHWMPLPEPPKGE